MPRTIRVLSSAVAPFAAGLAEGSPAPDDTERLGRSFVPACATEEELRIVVVSIGSFPVTEKSNESISGGTSADGDEKMAETLFLRASSHMELTSAFYAPSKDSALFES